MTLRVSSIPHRLNPQPSPLRVEFISSRGNAIPNAYSDPNHNRGLRALVKAAQAPSRGPKRDWWVWPAVYQWQGTNDARLSTRPEHQMLREGQTPNAISSTAVRGRWTTKALWSMTRPIRESPHTWPYRRKTMRSFWSGWKSHHTGGQQPLGSYRRVQGDLESKAFVGLRVRYGSPLSTHLPTTVPSG